MTAAKRPRGRPLGVPLCRRRALEAAILDALTHEIRDARGARRGAAYPPGWKRANGRQVQRHVVKVLGALGFIVSERTARAAWYDTAPIDDDRRADWPRNIRHAADLLNFDGDDKRRDSLVDAIGTWCIAETKAGRGCPLAAGELALAFKKAGKKIDAE